GAPEDDGGANIIEYRLSRGPSIDLLEEYKVIVGSEVLQFNDTGVEAGKTYYYTVTSVNSFGESTSSNAVRAEVPKSSSRNQGSALWIFVIVLIILIGGGLASYFLLIKKRVDDIVGTENDPERKDPGQYP
ncbi:MAG: fibronectin type III domain-containing protein, partial [Candidatus Thermoplasmatota archaeon]|nr:fibronectin type III domain-containing protein [Candidatus Thermoplasmatota archaeon]